VQFGTAVAFYFQIPWITARWPFEGTTPLTFIFLASILAAAGASTLWATASGNYGALAGVGLDYLGILTPVSILLFQLAARTGSLQVTLYGVAVAAGALFGLGLLLRSIRIPIDPAPPMPGLVRWSFAAFVVGLVVVSVRLLLKEPNSVPWTITEDLSLLIGWMFVGAAAYFVYGLLHPSWRNAAGQLAGFLAYDLVLIVPFLQRLGGAAPEHRPGLIVYTAVVVYSGIVAMYFLLLHRSTRVWGG
jgi:hypothetical protein